MCSASVTWKPSAFWSKKQVISPQNVGIPLNFVRLLQALQGSDPSVVTSKAVHLLLPTFSADDLLLRAASHVFSRRLAPETSDEE